MKLGCSVLTTLMASPEGVRYLLTEDEFLTQIYRAFEQLRPVSIFILSSDGLYTQFLY